MCSSGSLGSGILVLCGVVNSIYTGLFVAGRNWTLGEVPRTEARTKGNTCNTNSWRLQGLRLSRGKSDCLKAHCSTAWVFGSSPINPLDCRHKATFEKSHSWCFVCRYFLTPGHYPQNSDHSTELSSLFCAHLDLKHHWVVLRFLASRPVQYAAVPQGQFEGEGNTELP